MGPNKISIKALEVFLAVARLGTLRDGARDVGISISTASHHVSELENAVGTDLFDHDRRPMVLTPAGQIMRNRAEEAMSSLRKGLTEIWSEDAQTLVRTLRLAMIEDFDADVAPALTKDLIHDVPQCDLSLMSRPTHEVLDLLTRKKVDLGVAATADFDGSGMIEMPVLRDPFILVLPGEMSDRGASLPDLRVRSNELPFLRYNSRQLLGQRIEAQLRRLNLRFPHRMSFETTHVILSLVAAGQGWTITTALSFARAQRYHGDLTVCPFPGGAFSREISVFAQDDVPESVTALAAASLRRSIADLVIAPTVAALPWLADSFVVLGGEASKGCETGI